MLQIHTNYNLILRKLNKLFLYLKIQRSKYKPPFPPSDTQTNSKITRQTDFCSSLLRCPSLKAQLFVNLHIKLLHTSNLIHWRLVLMKAIVMIYLLCFQQQIIRSTCHTLTVLEFTVWPDALLA